jgi:hypothetical protein
LSNDEADVLANIGSQCLAIPPGVFWEEITERSTKPKKSAKKGDERETLRDFERNIGRRRRRGTGSSTDGANPMDAGVHIIHPKKNNTRRSS